MPSVRFYSLLRLICVGGGCESYKPRLVCLVGGYLLRGYLGAITVPCRIRAAAVKASRFSSRFCGQAAGLPRVRRSYIAAAARCSLAELRDIFKGVALIVLL
jgi:hypothetical protein